MLIAPPFKSGPDFVAEVFVPNDWALDQESDVVTTPPGALCVLTPFGRFSVLLERHRYKDFGVRQMSWAKDPFWQPHLVGPVFQPLGCNTRAATWGQFEQHRPAVGDRLVFAPETLMFTEEQYDRIHRGQLPGRHYAFDRWGDIYTYYKLATDREYIVEVVFPGPFIKVEGVSIVTGCEVWRRS